MAPKASGRIIPYDGLPPGWQAIEKDFLSGSNAGKTYVRFQNDTNKGVSSIRAALKLHAEETGQDSVQVLAEYDRQKDEDKAKRQREKESKGFLEGPKRDEAVEAFRSAHGKLDGATVCQLPGWKGESKILEKSNQIVARYYAPNGDGYSLLINIEAMFGVKLMNGEEIPDIAAARACIAKDDTGKVINVARRENTVADFTENPERPPKRKKVPTNVLVAGEDDYRDTEFLKVLRLRSNSSPAALEEEKVGDIEGVLQDAEHVHRALVGRGFASETELLYVTGSRNSRTIGRKALDSLSGIYYKRPDEYCGRVYYQRVWTADNNSNGALGCGGLFLCWSDSQQLWKLGQLFENKAGFAVCRQDKNSPVDLDATWELYEPKVEGGEGDAGGEGNAGEDAGGAPQDTQNTNQDTNQDTLD